MRRLIIAATCFGLLGALPTTAGADGWYVSEMAGGLHLRESSGQLKLRHGFSARAAVGHNMDDWAIEGFLRVGTHRDRNDTHAHSGYGVAVRRLFRRGRYVNLYLRGDLHRMTIRNDQSAADPEADTGKACCVERELSIGGYSGRGIGAGGGLILSGRVRALGFLAWPFFLTKIGPKVTLSFWIDAGGRYARLHKPYSPAIDVSGVEWAGGVSVGGGF